MMDEDSPRESTVAETGRRTAGAIASLVGLGLLGVFMVKTLLM
jgi:hypothetical protein